MHKRLLCVPATSLISSTYSNSSLQEFQLQTITLKMSDAKRPNHMALYKSIDGKHWSALAYKVTTETECVTKFGVILSSQPADVDGYVCSSYGKPMANPFEEVGTLYHYAYSMNPTHC